MIDFFSGEHAYLSNFYERAVTYNGVTYQNSEAAFHAQKTLNPAMRLQFADLNPSDAKKLGRKVKLREDWESVKDTIMYEVCLCKFLQNPDLKEKLLATGNEKLEEGTYWHDNYWGNCHCEKCKDVVGKNHLGEILMKVREKIKND